MATSRTDMGRSLSSGQGETAAATVAVAAVSLTEMSAVGGVERVVATRVSSDMRGLVTAGREFRVGVDRLSKERASSVAWQRDCS
jgi:hypothetical protein